MEQHSTKVGNWFLIVGSVAGWFALIAQLYLIIVKNQIPVQESLVRYFSYFTILTNILVVLCFGFLLIKSHKTKFFTNPKTLAATVVYITVVGLTYNMILRFTWEPQGTQLIVDELLHVIMPVLFIVYWLAFVEKQSLGWKNILVWLIYPLIYLLFILFRGALSGFYPYPFLDVNNLGYNMVLLNSFYIFILFLVLSFLIAWIGRSMMKSKPKIR